MNQLRDQLTAALPDWALVIETGIRAAPFVGFHRFGARVFCTTVSAADFPDFSDECAAMQQLAEQAMPRRAGFTHYATCCTVTVFDDERDASTFMRDVRRLTRRAGNDARRGAECEIPV